MSRHWIYDISEKELLDLWLKSDEYYKSKEVEQK